MNKFYTYAYLREDRTPYYIGKGIGKRAYDSCHNVKVPKDKDRIIFLKQNLSEDEAFKHEIYMIAVFGRKDLGTGILRNMSKGGEGHSNPSPEARRKNAESSSLQYRMGIGIGGLTEEQEEKRKINASIESKKWRIKNNFNGGSLGRTSQKHSADSVRAMENGCAKYWKSMPEEERYALRLEQGKKGGAKNKELGIGICGLTFDERSKNAKKKFEDPDVVEKYRQQMLEHCKNGTGAYATGVREKGIDTRYKNKKGFGEFCVRSPEGKSYKGKGRKPFAREHGLSTTAFNNLVRGRIKYCKGWTKVNGESNE